MTRLEESGRLLWNRMLWLPSYGDCFYCSTYDKQVPARYEFWFTLTEESIRALMKVDLPPYTECQTACKNCAAELWVEDTEDMRIVMARDLR